MNCPDTHARALQPLLHAIPGVLRRKLPCRNSGCGAKQRHQHVLAAVCAKTGCEADGSALGTVVRVWAERQIELRGVYEINLTSTALAALLASGHPALADVQVCGAFSLGAGLLKNDSNKVETRLAFPTGEYGHITPCPLNNGALSTEAFTDPLPWLSACGFAVPCCSMLALRPSSCDASKMGFVGTGGAGASVRLAVRGV